MAEGQPRPIERDAAVELGALSVFSRRQRWALLTVFALLVIFRLPHAWEHGRFLDEEATVFLAYAWHRPWLDALFRPFGGYWNLGANATTLLVVELVKHGVVPLVRAPYLTMLMALVAQMLPAVLILIGRARWLAGRAAVIASLLIIAMAPATEEVFFNVMHIQFHLALCVALILALEVPQRRIEAAGYGMLLLMAPLCGPAAIVILPLFALRALIDHDLGRAKQLVPFVVGAAIQFATILQFEPTANFSRDPATIAATMFVRLIALPTFGSDSANRIGHMINYLPIVGTVLLWWAAADRIPIFQRTDRYRFGTKGCGYLATTFRHFDRRRHLRFWNDNPPSCRNVYCR